MTSNRTPVDLHNEYSVLNLADLLLARELNHVELMRRPNVIGTAVGLYLIRKSEPWSKKSSYSPPGERPPRTLENSEVRAYSWPCILVFVDDWKSDSQLTWHERVPDSLYLDEKRKVPVCVVYAPRQDAPEIPIRPVIYPSSRIGGGFPVIADVQGREHVASVGCLVRDGHTVYALTNRHVTGPEGEIAYAQLAGEKVRIGVSSSKQLTRMLFPKMYPGLHGKETYLNLDIGLIRVDNLNHWTASVYGVGTMGAIADLGLDNLSLRLIDCPVRAYGCGSGHMKGAIKALFYRYKSLGGFEYVSDFLIGGRQVGQDLSTHPGDSGTVWLLEISDKDLRPIAVQWGGQVFADGNGRQQSSYALATCLSTVCNHLDVDVIRDWNIGVSEYWGEVGHFAIGALACTVKFSGLPGLAKFLSRNIRQVGFEEADLRNPDKVLKNRAHFKFVPLADVADDVWRITRASQGETGDDGNNHFADMDQKAESGPFKGKTLLQLTENDDNVDPAVWSEFYKGVSGTRPGALPFRVWQGYNEMVDALKKKDILGFLCAAGTTAHYVGDACQPLHVSRLHHGFPENQTTTSKKVHSTYETEMLNVPEHTDALITGIIAGLKNRSVTGSFKDGKGAAVRVIALMRDTIMKLPPIDIVNAYNAESGPAKRIERLWHDFGTKTIARMVDGCVCMADIWASAWKEGKGEDLPASALTAQDQQKLQDLYRKASFFPSMSLAKMIPLLTGGAQPMHPEPKPKSKTKVKSKVKSKAKGTVRKRVVARRRVEREKAA